MKDPVLGIDIGGVIMDKVNDQTDTSFFSDNYLRTTATAHVMEAIRKLAIYKFKQRIFLVSKCGVKVQEKTLNWLDYHRFYTRTGVGTNKVHFCRERADKAKICEELGITHFVDDRLEVLSYLDTVGTKYLFQANQKEVDQHKKHLPKVVRVESWLEVLEKELATVVTV